MTDPTLDALKRSAEDSARWREHALGPWKEEAERDPLASATYGHAARTAPTVGAG